VKERNIFGIESYELKVLFVNP